MENLSGKDLNGNTFRIGDSVLLPKPEKTDSYKTEGVGHVSKFGDNNQIIVVKDEEIINITQNRVESLPVGM